MERGTGWEIGKKCKRCGDGRYWPTGKRGKIEKIGTGEIQDYIELECDQCGHKLHQLVIEEEIRPSVLAKVEKVG
jgi:DNA-directed RNA polymerase subunit RPC12/RpoP